MSTIRTATVGFIATLFLAACGSPSETESSPAEVLAHEDRTEESVANATRLIIKARLVLDCNEELRKVGIGSAGCFAYAEKLLALTTNPLFSRLDPINDLRETLDRGEAGTGFSSELLQALSASASLSSGVPPHPLLDYDAQELPIAVRLGAFQKREWSAVEADSCGDASDSPIFLRCVRRAAQRYLESQVPVISMRHGGPLEAVLLNATRPEVDVLGVDPASFPQLPLPVCGDNDTRVSVPVWEESEAIVTELGDSPYHKRDINSVPPTGPGLVVYIERRRPGNCPERDFLSSYSYPYFDPDDGAHTGGAGGLAVNMRGGTSWANGTCNRIGFFKNEVVEGIHLGWTETYFGYLEDAPVSLAGRFCLERPAN